MWVINIRHWLNVAGTKAGVPQLRNKVKKMTEIITYATSIYAGVKEPAIPKCWRRPKRKPCNGKLDTSLDHKEAVINFYCPKCQDEGIITGWKGLIWDISNVVDSQN